MGKIANFKELAITELRKAALEIAEAGLEAIDTEKAVKKGVVLDGDILKVKEKTFDLSGFERLFVVGVGKCALEAGRVLEDILGDRLTNGIVLDIRPGSLKKIRIFAGTHPFPTTENVNATAEIIHLLSSLTEKDFVIFVISGGGSTLLCQPKNLICQDEKDILTHLFNVGANIEEINTIRKHLSLARGGFLASYAHLASSVALVFSDVPGGALEFIASGPTVKDTTTINDARAVIDKYLPESAQKSVIVGGLIETPKEDEYFGKITNVLFLDNMTALETMSAKAKELGFNPKIRTNVLDGEARGTGEKIALDIGRAESKSVILYGGETTVTIKNDGKGGRNLEVALGALGEIGGNELVLSFDSDGHDNTDFAGALCDKMTSEKAAKLGLEPEEFLKDNDSYEFFRKVGDYILTGDTGSNVSDLIIAIKE
jgi:glycerate-2-kinase